MQKLINLNIDYSIWRSNVHRCERHSRWHEDLLILTLTLIFLKFPQNLQWERKNKRDRECEEDLPEDIVLLAQGGKKNT